MIILGVFLINQIRTGGDRRYLELMELLAERSNNVFVIMNSFLDYTPQYFKKIEFPVKYVRHRFPPASFLFQRTIKRNLNAIYAGLARHDVNGFDIIHIHGDMHLKAAVSLHKLFRKPLFYASRCNDIDRAKILWKSGGLSPKEYLISLIVNIVNISRERQAAKYAELITMQNIPDRDRFITRTNFPVERTVIIPGNIGPPRFKAEWQNKNTSTQVKNIVYVGSLSAGKGLWDLFKALGQLKAKGLQSLHCHLLGRDENSDSTKVLLKRLKITDMVSFDGYIDPFLRLAECDLMVYPTLYDAYPDVVLEALHTGCPVLASSVGGLPDMLQYPELLFQSGNIDEIAGRIERCATDSGFYAHIRELCGERAAAHRFDWARRFEEAMAILAGGGL
jgi:glycosyltransferase involved in cell wall biosynthesis